MVYQNVRSKGPGTERPFLRKAAVVTIFKEPETNHMGTSELWVKMAWHLQHVKTHSVLHKVEQ
jgi:hypothetical protein